MARLKVFCTTSGFYDHVVAAKSRPAALKAWGAKTDLFSMGVARQVSDPKIEKKALQRPGEVIRFKRSGGGEEVSVPKRKMKRRTKRPSRAKLDSVEKRLAELERSQSKEISEAQRVVMEARKKLELLARRHASARRAAERKVEESRDAYEAALAEWDASKP